MKPEHWPQIEQMYHTALERRPDERAAFLDEACAGNPTLRHEVESLLACDDRVSQFMASPPDELAAEMMADEQTTMAMGQRISHYQILSRLGKGGMGEVFLAQDTNLKRQVAIKLLPANFTTDAVRVQRFEREARAASALNHPNILTIHEIGQTDATHFLVTEFVDGQTLRQQMKAAPMSLSAKLEIAIQIANALAAAHAAGIIHRDIKPENVMVREDGLVKVLDFGLAKLLRDEGGGMRDESEKETPIHPSSLIPHSSTMPGIVMGTPRYMSPEQARGEKVDARTDIFSFGVMLYEMLAGRAPFAGATASETIAAILRDEPLTLSKHAPDTPTELQRIVSKALRKERDERYQTVKDLLLDLKGVQQEISAPTIRTTVERETKRQPAWLLPTLISLVVLLLAAGAFWFVKWRGSVGEARPDERPVIVKTTQLTFWKGLDFYPALSPDGKTIAFSSDRSGSFEIYTKQLVAGAREMPITTDGGHNFQPTFSPDGNFIAYHSKKRGGIWVVPATGGAARRLTEFGAHPAWSPGDGAQLAFQSETFQMIGYRTLNVARTSTLWTVSSQGGEPRQLTHAGAQPGGHGAPAWSPDGKRLVFDAAGVVWSVSAQGDDLKKLSAPVKGALGAVYAPDGQSVYFTADDGWSLYHVSLSAAGDPVGEPALVFSGSGSHINKLSLAANGKSLVYAALTTSSNIWAQPLAPKTYAVSGKPVQLTQTANTCDVAPVYSPDGKTIAYFTFATGAPRQLWTMGVDGNNQTQIPAVTGSFPSWFPDGKRLTFRSSQDGLWAVSLEGGQGQKIFSFDGDTDEAVLTPDGQHVAFISRRGGAPNLWVAPLAGGAPKQLTFEQEAVSHPAWSRDGKWLAFELKRGRDGHVAIISSEGGAPVQLTSVPGLSLVSDWSPDGQRILFAGQRAGVWNVWSVARADKRQQQLTSYTKFDSYVRGPAWSPRGEQIVYEYAENTGNIWLMELK